MKMKDTVSVIWSYIPQYLRRNRVILTDRTRPTEPKKVNVHYWRKNKLVGQEDNLGDYLAVILVEQMKKRLEIDDGKKLKKTRHLYAVGSILQAGYQNATVWGSGFLEDPVGGKLAYLMHGKPLRKLDVRAVRGPLTRSALLKLGHNCPEVYGDPAILMPLFYQPQKTNEKKPYVIVRHFSDKNKQASDLNILTTDYQSFIDSLCHSERVVSSSLHGIILAEAYGIPAVLYLPESSESELTLYKYKDYYMGTGRSEFPVAHTIEEALTMQPCEIPDMTQQSENLFKAFPLDLWN